MRADSIPPIGPEKPASTYLISLVAAPLVRIQDRWRDVPLSYYVYPEDSALARPLFGMTPDVVETYARLTGVAYPWNKYAQVTAADFIGGMENVGATTLVDWLPDPRASGTGRGIASRSSRTSWRTSGRQPGDGGELGQLLAARGTRGVHAGPVLGREARPPRGGRFLPGGVPTVPRPRCPTPHALAAYNSSVVYPKGALVMEMLKQYLGPQRFWRAINRYFTRHAYGSATTDDLRQAVLEATGESLSWFWSQWMYRAGHPEFQVASAYDSSARALTLTVRQTQTDTTKPDANGVRYRRPRSSARPWRCGSGHRRATSSRGRCSRRASRPSRSRTCPRRPRWWCSTTRTRS